MHGKVGEIPHSWTFSSSAVSEARSLGVTKPRIRTRRSGPTFWVAARSAFASGEGAAAGCADARGLLECVSSLPQPASQSAAQRTAATTNLIDSRSAAAV